MNNRCLDELISSLQDNDLEVRKSAAISLGKLGMKEAIDPLLNLLNDSDLSVKRSAAYALSELGDPGSFDLLKEDLNYGSEDIQKNALEALSKIKDPRVVDLFLERMTYLENTNHRDHNLSIRDFNQALEIIGTSAINPLICALNSDNPKIRKNAARVLRNIRITDRMPSAEYGSIHHCQSKTIDFSRDLILRVNNGTDFQSKTHAI